MDKAHLLVERLARPVLTARYSRRKFLIKAGVVGLAALLPTVISIVSPTAAQAATCLTDCAGTGPGPSGLPCNPTQCKKFCCSEVCRSANHPDCA